MCSKIIRVLLVLINVVAISCTIYKNLKYFETLHASELSHNIVKRGVNPSLHPFNKIKEVSFDTLGRHFRLILNPQKEVFHSQFKAFTIDGDGEERPLFIDTEQFYHGRVFGEISSDVSVHLDDGLMTASINLPDDTYHIEKPL